MRKVLAAAALCCAALAARAQDAWAPGSVRHEVEAAVRAGEPAKALSILDALLADTAPRIRARNVEAARAAWDLLPRTDAAPRAAQFLAEALRLDPSDRDGAWKLAQEVRKDLVRRVDVETGVRFLAKLAELYPTEPAYRHEAALLCLDGGRRAEAREHLRANIGLAPSDTWPAYRLAVLLEEDEEIDDAIAVYDRMLVANPKEHRALLVKAKLLATRDRAAARAAIDEGVRAVESAGSESGRAGLLEEFAYERRRIDAAEARITAISEILRRIGWTTALALAAWAAVAAALHRATRVPRN